MARPGQFESSFNPAKTYSARTLRDEFNKPQQPKTARTGNVKLGSAVNRLLEAINDLTTELDQLREGNQSQNYKPFQATPLVKRYIESDAVLPRSRTEANIIPGYMLSSSIHNA